MQPIYYPLNEQLARTAHEANSFREFRSDTPDYKRSVDEAYEIAEKAAERSPERAEEAYSLADRYAQKYAEWINKGYRIESMCPSIMVSGGGNFPVKKKERQNRARDNHYKELRKVEYLKDKISKIGTSAETIKCDDAEAESKLQAKIDNLVKKQEDMKAANAKARKEGREVPYPAYALSNNNQNIRATKKRLEAIQAQKDQETTERTIEFMGESVLVVENAEIMRLQLIFDGKPDEEIRSVLKRNGFRWSPKNEAWQRQLTNNAKSSLRIMLKQHAA